MCLPLDSDTPLDTGHQASNHQNLPTALHPFVWAQLLSAPCRDYEGVALHDTETACTPPDALLPYTTGLHVLRHSIDIIQAWRTVLLSRFRLNCLRVDPSFRESTQHLISLSARRSSIYRVLAVCCACVFHQLVMLRPSTRHAQSYCSTLSLSPDAFARGQLRQVYIFHHLGSLKLL